MCFRSGSYTVAALIIYTAAASLALAGGGVAGGGGGGGGSDVTAAAGAGAGAGVGATTGEDPPGALGVAVLDDDDAVRRRELRLRLRRMDTIFADAMERSELPLLRCAPCASSGDGEAGWGAPGEAAPGAGNEMAATAALTLVSGA